MGKRQDASSRIVPAKLIKGPISRRSFLKATGASALALGLKSGFPNVLAGPVDNTLTYGLFGEPANLNPFFRMGIHGNQVASNLFNRLTRINPQEKSVNPELATEWGTEDPLTWVIKVREGVQWHKGYGEVTAEDVAFTFNYILDNETFQLGTALFPVERANVRDRYTVEVKLKTPFSPFPIITMEYGGYIMCKAAHEEMGAEAYGRNPVGTGPFVFEEWVTGSHIRVKKNTDYWRGEGAHLDEVLFRFIPEASVRLASLMRGEIDFMGSPDSSDVPRFRNGEEPDIAFHSVPGWNWDYMAFTFPPFIDADFPTQKKEVRQAMSYAIDRQILADEIYGGEALPTDSPVPPGYLSYRDVPIVYPARADLDKARSLMAQAGVDGFDLEVITSDKEWLRRETELVAAMLSEININVIPQGLDVGTWTERWIRKHDFQALLEDISIVSPDVDSSVFWFHREDTVGYHGWPNPRTTELLDEGRLVTDASGREAIYREVVDNVLDELPYLYLLHVNYVYLHNDNLAGFSPSPQEFTLLLDKVQWKS